jgi:hypothetical protein
MRLLAHPLGKGELVSSIPQHQFFLLDQRRLRVRRFVRSATNGRTKREETRAIREKSGKFVHPVFPAIRCARLVRCPPDR